MRPGQLPAGAVCYKRIGPFRGEQIPAGLLREHRLKVGVWGRVTLLDGALRFVWDDGSNDTASLTAPATIIVPPTVPHHLESTDSAEILIEFHSVENSQ